MENLYEALPVKRGPQHLKTVSSVERQLSKAMQRVDPSIVVPPYEADSDRRARQSQRKPFIYTEAQMLQLLETTKSFESNKSPLRAASLHMMILLTYCAGLRIGELARLTLADVDVKENVIQIRNTKFFKSRNLPLAPSVGLVLKDYLEVRRDLDGSSEPASGLFWREPRGGSYSCGGIRNLLTKALRRAGLKPLHGRSVRESTICATQWSATAWKRGTERALIPSRGCRLGHLSRPQGY